MAELAARRLRLPSARAVLRREFAATLADRFALGLTACVVVGALGFANGGYFPVSWGWSALALLVLITVALAVGVSVELGALDWLFLSALAGLTTWVALSLLWTGSVPKTVFENERML